MADGNPIIIGQDNTASNPGNETILRRTENTAATVFVARNLNLGDGIHGEASGGGNGVSGTSSSGPGVVGRSAAGGAGAGVVGITSGGTSDSNAGAGVRGQCEDPFGWAGYFVGDVEITSGGNLTISGNKLFKIDHPLDPQNKYLFHSAVESSERKNVYDGVAELEGDGAAWVDLPDWFEALNGDFRYQLTAVGGSAPDLHVAEEVSENRFRIAGGQGGMKVCWQVMGSRKDRWAAANPFEVEQEKPQGERGRYLVPSLYDAPEEQSVVRPLAERVAEEQRPPEPSGIDFARLEEHRREMEELRRRMEERQEEAPPEST